MPRMAQDKLEALLLEMGLKASLNEKVSGRLGKAQRALEDALKAAGKQRLKGLSRMVPTG